MFIFTQHGRYSSELIRKKIMWIYSWINDYKFLSAKDDQTKDTIWYYIQISDNSLFNIMFT